MKEDQAWELKSKYVEKKYDNRVIARQEEEEKKWNEKFEQRVADTWSPEKRELLDGGQGKQSFFFEGKDGDIDAETANTIEPGGQGWWCGHTGKATI